MSLNRPIPPRFARSPIEEPNGYKQSRSWGKFVRYLEFSDDAFALRQVDAYSNGNAVAYDREHWEDDFGSLADFRFGHKWLLHWGTPVEVTAQTFEAQWLRAEAMRQTLGALRQASGPPPWIELFNGGLWSGQK